MYLDKLRKKFGVVGDIVVGAVLVAAFLLFLYFCYYIVKTVSYNIFYEDMVRGTITEMVKENSLRR